MLPLLLLLASAPAQMPDTSKPMADAAKPSFPGCLDACPPQNDPAPFLRLPKITTIEECRSDGTGNCDVSSGWVQTFHAAARFNIPKFDRNLEAMETDALIIYEGMKLTVNDKTGVYDVAFTATAPLMPATVRLQMVFGHEDLLKPIRMTLPPIRIESDNPAQSGDNSGRTVRIHHRGQSDLFIKTLDAKQSAFDDFKGKPFAHCLPPSLPLLTPRVNPFPISKSWTIRREGTARFGSAQISADDNDR